MLAETMSTIGTKLLTSAGHERMASSSEFRNSMAAVASAISYGEQLPATLFNPAGQFRHRCGTVHQSAEETGDINAAWAVNLPKNVVNKPERQ
jgi:hypothetical protein